MCLSAQGAAACETVTTMPASGWDHKPPGGQARTRVHILSRTHRCPSGQ